MIFIPPQPPEPASAMKLHTNAKQTFPYTNVQEKPDTDSMRLSKSLVQSHIQKEAPPGRGTQPLFLKLKHQQHSILLHKTYQADNICYS